MALTLEAKLFGRSRGCGRSTERTKEIRDDASGYERACREEVNVVQQDDSRALLADRAAGESFGVKWVSRDVDHRARRLVYNRMKDRMT